MPQCDAPNCQKQATKYITFLNESVCDEHKALYNDRKLVVEIPDNKHFNRRGLIPFSIHSKPHRIKRFRKEDHKNPELEPIEQEVDSIPSSEKLGRSSKEVKRPPPKLFENRESIGEDMREGVEDMQSEAPHTAERAERKRKSSTTPEHPGSYENVEVQRLATTPVQINEDALQRTAEDKSPSLGLNEYLADNPVSAEEFRLFHVNAIKMHTRLQGLAMEIMEKDEKIKEKDGHLEALTRGNNDLRNQVHRHMHAIAQFQHAVKSLNDLKPN